MTGGGLKLVLRAQPHPRFLKWNKTYDTVSRDVLRKIKATFGFPPRFKAQQGCVMAQTLFSMMFSAMLTDVFQDCDTDFSIRYRFDAKLFDLRRLQAKF